MEIRSVAVAAEVAVAAVAVVVGGGGVARVALAARVVSVKEQLCSWSFHCVSKITLRQNEQVAKLMFSSWCHLCLFLPVLKFVTLNDNLYKDTLFLPPTTFYSNLTT